MVDVAGTTVEERVSVVVTVVVGSISRVTVTQPVRQIRTPAVIK
jgi:hypothetical protein